MCLTVFVCLFQMPSRLFWRSSSRQLPTSRLSSWYTRRLELQLFVCFTAKPMCFLQFCVLFFFHPGSADDHERNGHDQPCDQPSHLPDHKSPHEPAAPTPSQPLRPHQPLRWHSSESLRQHPTQPLCQLHPHSLRSSGHPP